MVKVNRIYKHYKGDLYIVEGIAKDSETLENIILYRALYEEGTLWARTEKDFTKEVNKQGQKYRFELQEIPSKRNK